MNPVTVVDMSETSIDTSVLNPIAIDTELARIWALIDRNQERLDRSKGDLTSKHQWGPKRGLPRYPDGDAYLEGKVAEYEANLAALRAEAKPYQDEYFTRPWHRYFLVTNGNGHVHRDMACRTCYPTTRYAWLVELADCDEAAMVDEFGEKACTVCFPDAPALPAFHAPGRRDREALAARQAEKAARAAAKQAKLLDTPIKGLKRSSWTIETVAAAKQQIRDNIYDIRWNGYPHVIAECQADNDVLIEALVRKGITRAEIDTLIERAQKKAR
jgi:hypothetical protein